MNYELWTHNSKNAIRELKLILRRGMAIQTRTSGPCSLWQNYNLFCGRSQRNQGKNISRCLASRLSTVPPRRLETFFIRFFIIQTLPISILLNINQFYRKGLFDRTRKRPLEGEIIWLSPIFQRKTECSIEWPCSSNQKYSLKTFRRNQNFEIGGIFIKIFYSQKFSTFPNHLSALPKRQNFAFLPNCATLPSRSSARH